MGGISGLAGGSLTGTRGTGRRLGIVRRLGALRRLGTRLRGAGLGIGAGTAEYWKIEPAGCGMPCGGCVGVNATPPIWPSVPTSVGMGGAIGGVRLAVMTVRRKSPNTVLPEPLIALPIHAPTVGSTHLTATGSATCNGTGNYLRRLRRIFAMYRFAAAEPFTNRATRFFPFRRFRLAAVGAALFFFRRRVRAEFIPPRRPDARNIACTAGVCCAKPANPPGGTIKLGMGPPVMV